MADQEYNGEAGDNQYDGDQQMYTQSSGYENRQGGDGDEKKRDDDDRKIFVGGISWDTTQKDLRDYFAKFGDVVDTTLKTDVETGRSRGFGFVLFNDKSSVEAVINHSEPHNLHGRTIDPKRARGRPKPEPVKKVFVGGLDNSVPEDEIKDYFAQFGKVVELDLPFDKIKNQRRAFCFITFEDESAVERACETPKQILGGKEVDVKKATPKQDSHGAWGQQNWGGYGGRGRGGFDRGGRGGRGRGRGGGQGQGWGQSGWGGGQGGYNDYYSSYSQPYGGSTYNGSGQYDYYSNQNYGNYGGYDNYYQGWGNYNQSGGSYGGYGGSGGNYDGYSGWYGGQGQQQGGGGGQQQTQQASNYGKQKTTGQGVGRGGGYHPYARQ